MTDLSRYLKTATAPIDRAKLQQAHALLQLDKMAWQPFGAAERGVENARSAKLYPEEVANATLQLLSAETKSDMKLSFRKETSDNCGRFYVDRGALGVIAQSSKGRGSQL